MAMTVTYTRIGGQLVGETRNGVSTHYISDPDGNLVGEMNEEGEVTYSCEYWPDGTIQSETGTKVSDWGFRGLVGCRTDSPNMIFCGNQVYQPKTASWLQRQMPWEPRPKPIPDPGIGPPPINTGCKTCACWNDYVFRFCNNCARKPKSDPCHQRCSQLGDWYYRACKGSRKGNDWPWFLQPWQPQNPPFMPPSQIVPGPGPNTNPYCPDGSGWPGNKFGPPQDCGEVYRSCLASFGGDYCAFQDPILSDPFCTWVTRVCQVITLECVAANALKGYDRWGKKIKL